MKRAKLSQGLYVNITYEMMMWIDRLAAESGTKRGTVVRALLQVHMDEDKQAEGRAA